MARVKQMRFCDNYKLTSLIYVVGCLGLGIAFLVIPSLTELFIIRLFAGLLLVAGVLEIVNYFLYGLEPTGFWTGCLDLAFGVVLMCTAPIISESAVFAVICGLIFILIALKRAQTAFEYRRSGSSRWWLTLVLATFSLIHGIIFLSNPYHGKKVLLLILGIILIIEAVEEFVSVVVITYKVKHVKRSWHDLFYNEDTIEIVHEDSEEVTK